MGSKHYFPSYEIINNSEFFNLFATKLTVCVFFCNKAIYRTHHKKKELKVSHMDLRLA